MDRQHASYYSRMKRAGHNIFGFSAMMCSLVYALGIAWCLLLLSHVYLRHLPLLVQVLISMAVSVLACAAVLITANRNRIEIRPYCRQSGFEFLGLYDLKGTESANQHDVLPRDEEIAFMHRLLEETIFPQVSVKQALCLTGRSGCGKSTILAFFRHAFEEQYKIFDFSGNYREFYGHMTALFGSNIDLKIREMTQHSKVIFILDQFERYFSLPSEQQKSVRDMIRHMCCENTAVIISMREEYLADFLKQFDMNNLLASDETAGVEPRGVLQPIINIIEKKGRPTRPHAPLLRLDQTLLWDGYAIKQNSKEYLDAPDRSLGRIVLEQLGATLFYCRNQNEVTSQLGGIAHHDSLMESKCRLLFGEKGTELYKKHEDQTLIEQQMIFHMAEFNQKILSRPEEDLQQLIDGNNNELFEQYFDVQLSSCQSFFHASRVMYLLSQARIHHLSMKTADLEDALFPNLFDKKGHARLMENMDQLEKLQLIRKNTDRSSQEYEIAHDFIASAFLSYCSNSMNRDTKNALDLFISEYMDEKLADAVARKIAHRKQVYPQRFFPIATGIAIGFMVLCYLIERFIYNPWSVLWPGANPYGTYVPAFPLFITVASVIYLCFMYNHVAKYFHGGGSGLCRCIYCILMFLASMAVFAYPHFLLIDGIDLALAAMYFAFLLNGNYRQTCRNELAFYGYKSCMIGLVFGAAHIVFFIFNRTFDDYMILIEFIMFTILVSYAFLAHMTQEFLFARMADASSETIRQNASSIV